MQEKISGTGLEEGGSGQQSPLPGRGIFDNLQKHFLRKLQICSIIAYFLPEKIKNPGKVPRVWAKNTITWERCLKNLKILDQNSIDLLAASLRSWKRILYSLNFCNKEYLFRKKFDINIK